MQWIVLTVASGVLFIGLWTLVSMFLMLRDYDDIEWDDDDI